MTQLRDEGATIAAAIEALNDTQRAALLVELINGATPEIRRSILLELGGVIPEDIGPLVDQYLAEGGIVPPPPVVGAPPVIEPVIPPKFNGTITAGDTFADLTAQTYLGTAKLVGVVDDEVIHVIDIGILWISSGGDPVTPGDHFTGYRGVYTSEGLETAYGPVIPLDIHVPLITSTLNFDPVEVPEGVTLVETDFHGDATSPISYKSNVSDAITIVSTTISGVVTNATTMLTPGLVTLEVLVRDGVGTEHIFEFSALVVAVVATPTIKVVQNPALVQISAGAQVSTALNPAGTLTIDGAAIAPTATWYLDGVEVAPTTLTAAGQIPRVVLVFAATGAESVPFDLTGPAVKAVAVVDPGTTSSTMSYDGVTATFDSPRKTGTYALGEPWVASEGTPVSIVRISPASASGVDRTKVGVPVGGAATTGPTVIHGAMLDPGKAPSGSTLAQRQAVNDGTTNGNDGQGYDQYVGANNYFWNGAKNVDPGYTGKPLVLTKGTIAKAISTTSGVLHTGRPPLAKMVALTVVETAPNQNAFRPGHSDPNKASWVYTTDIDMTKLPNLPAGTLAIPDFITALSEIRFITWQHTYNANARNILSLAGGAPIYGGDRDTWMETILALCYDKWTTSQKGQIVRAFVQMAIDIVARVEQGGVFQENGGHCVGQKSIVALAAHLTGHQRFIAALGATTTLFSWEGVANPVWGEDRQIFRITQADVNRRQKYQYNYPASMIGVAEWSSDASRDNPDAPANFRERLNTLTVLTKGVTAEDLKQHYRHIIAGVNVPAALALRLMGAAYLMSTKWLEYQDRYMTARIAANGALPDAMHNDIGAFTVAAWNKSRASAGAGGTPTTPTEPTDPTDPTDPPPPDPVEPDPVNIDHKVSTLAPGAPAIVLMRSQSLGSRQTESGGGFDNHPTDLRAENMHFYQQNKADANVTQIYETKFTQANTRYTINSAMIYLANALHFAAPGRLFVIAEHAEQGTSRKQDADNRDDATLRAFSNGVAIYNRLKEDYPQGAARMVEGWWSADFDEFADFLEVFAPYYFGQYADGRTFPLGTIHTVTKVNAGGGTASYQVDNCVYDFDEPNPALPGRGLLPRNVRFDALRKGPWGGDSKEKWAGLQKFYDDPRTKSLNGVYGIPGTNWISDGHPRTDTKDGQVKAGYDYFMAACLRAAGLPASESFFSAVTWAADGSYAHVHFVPANGGILSTDAKIRKQSWPVGELSQEIFGFEISRKAGGGRFNLIRPGSNYAPSRYQATAKIIGPLTAEIRPVEPFKPGDSITYMWGESFDYSGAPSVSSKSDPHRYILSSAIEHVAEYTDFTMDYPFAGFPARTFSEEFVAVLGTTTGSGAGSTGGGGGDGGGGTTEPDPTPPPPSTDPTVFFTTASNGPTFESASNLPSGTKRITYKMRLRARKVSASMYGTMFRVEAINCDFGFGVISDGSARFSIDGIRDSANVALTLVAGSSSVFQYFPAEVWKDAEADVDLETGKVTFKVSGLPDEVRTLASTGTGFFTSGRTGVLNGWAGRTDRTTGAGIDIASMSMHLNGSATAFLSISGDAATVNASPRKTSISGLAT